MKAGGGPGWSTKRPSFLVCRVKGSPRSQYPPSSAPTQITARATGTPRQLALMNAPDTGTHSEAAQSCLSPRHPKPPSLFPSPTPNPPLNAGHRNQEEIRASPRIPPAQTSSPSTGPPHLGPFPPGSPLPLNWPLPSVSPVRLPRAGGVQGHVGGVGVAMGFLDLQAVPRGAISCLGGVVYGDPSLRLKGR